MQTAKEIFLELLKPEGRPERVLRQYEAQLLAREEFMRIHRSYIVNMLQVAAFAPTEVRTFSGKSLPVSRLLYPQLQKDYLALLFHGRKE